MSEFMSKNGKMTYSATASNATTSAGTVNPSAKHLMTDEQRAAQMQPKMPDDKIITESENGDMMRSGSSAGNATSANTPNPEKDYLANDTDEHIDKAQRFKSAQQRLDEQAQDPKLTQAQQIQMMRMLMKDNISE